MHQQQHYTLFKIKKVKSLSTISNMLYFSLLVTVLTKAIQFPALVMLRIFTHVNKKGQKPEYTNNNVWSQIFALYKM